MTTTNVEDLTGRNAVDSDGEKIGKIEKIYLDNNTGQPTWVAISSGLLGSGTDFAPMYNAHASGDDVVLGVTKQKVKDSPGIEDDDGHLEPHQEELLFEYYSGYTGSRYTTQAQTTDPSVAGPQAES
jgi:sporulation protein YlmC with PRC-barrel domain